MNTLRFSHPASIAPAPVVRSQANLARFCDAHGLDCVLITSQDAFLSEYNVPGNNQRYALSGFSGSTGDGVFLSGPLAGRLELYTPFLLFVDGRYHLQAEQETCPEEVRLIKFPVTQTLDEAVLEWLKSVPAEGLRVGFDASRTSWKRFEAVQAVCVERKFELKRFDRELSVALGLVGWQTDRPIFPIPEKSTGRSIAANLKGLAERLPAGILPERSCILTCQSDDVAWLLNARGFHMPNASSFLAYCFVLGRDVVVFLPEGSDTCPMLLGEPPADGQYRLTTIRRDIGMLRDALTAHRGITRILFDGAGMNALLPGLALEIWPQASLVPDYNAIEVARVAKTPEELAAFRTAFRHSSRAIASTLRWVKASTGLANGAQTTDPEFNTPLSESDLSRKITGEYARQGALELSFRTIAGSGENSAVIHYSTPNPTKHLRAGEIVLLDSGAYYSEGFATDCTRVVYCPGTNKEPQTWQKQIYTVTLKACIHGMMARFGHTTLCRELDAQIRGVVQYYGYDYAHGTGHGVGIHVHEAGIRLAVTSTYKFTEQAVVSIEPGIYLNGKGGVRIENVAIVVPDPRTPGGLCFENLVYVGFDWDLINLQLLDEREKRYLREYELICRQMGTAVTGCPLIN